MSLPKEIHTLNDAILAAAKELSTRPKERRRIIYVVSDGKEFGSKASVKEVIRYLETNEIAVYGTLVGTSAAWGEGCSVLESCGIPADAAGVVVAATASRAFANDLIEAIGWHRHWERSLALAV